MRLERYNEQEALTRYIWRYYGHLMTDFEQEVGKVMLSREKADAASNPRVREKMLERFGQVDNVSIERALSKGHTMFRQRTAERVFAEHSDRIYINRCPSCSRIVRTPKAKQCQWCHYDWH